MSGVKPIKLTGRAYIKQAEAKDNPDCYLCIDSETTKGIIFGFFDKRDIENARLAAAALNLWAGFDVEDEPVAPLLIKN